MKILSESKLVLTPERMAARTHRRMEVGPRSPGVHVQAVNRALGVAAGQLSDSDDADFPFERMTEKVYPLMMALGCGWEEFMVSLWPEGELIWQPGELERDGLFGTYDGLVLTDPPAIWECKRTTKKVQSIAHCWMYVKQGLTYCAMSGLRRVHYDVLWVLGDYSRPYQPIATQILVEFEDKECEAWWGNVVRQAATMKGEGC
jgi:hypothetical protein